MSAGKKEYTIVINGVAESITNVTKLTSVLDALDASATKERQTNEQATTASTQKKAALTDEEKAATKLSDTQKKIADVNSAANKAQIAATQSLRDAQREVTRSVAINNLNEGSIAAMGMELTDLRRDYELLSAAQRANEAIGVPLLGQIQALDAEYKALRESTGNFRDSVGNYEKALGGLNQLQNGLNRVGIGASSAAAAVVGGNDALDLFGSAAQSAGKASASLAGIISIATTAQEAYNSVVEQGGVKALGYSIIQGVKAVQTKAAAAADALAAGSSETLLAAQAALTEATAALEVVEQTEVATTVELTAAKEAQAAAAAEVTALEAVQTETTIAATVAQAAYNLVAAANPYVLIALALIAVIAALVAFIGSTDKSAQTQKELNAQIAVGIDELNQYAEAQKAADDARQKNLQAEVDALTARGAKTNQIRTAEDALAKDRQNNSLRLRAFYADELAGLEDNRKKLLEFEDVLNKIKIAQAKGDTSIKLDIDLDGKIDNVKVADAVESVQGVVDNLKSKITIATGLNVDAQQIANDAKVQAAARIKEDRDLHNQQHTETLAAQRQLQTDVLKSVQDGYVQQRTVILQQYKADVQDLQFTLATQKYLSAATRKAMNDDIVQKAKVRDEALHQLGLQYQADQLASARAVIDSRNALIEGDEARQIVDTQTQYDRQIHDLQTKLKTDTTLNATAQADITEEIVNAITARNRAVAKIEAAGLEQRASVTLASVQDTLDIANDNITDFTGEVVKRSKTGLKLIDVDATKKNLADSNTALRAFITGVIAAQKQLDAAHAATLSTLKEGTPEYQDEVNKYTEASEASAKKIVASLKLIDDNQHASTLVWKDALKEKLTLISQYAQEASAVVSSVMDAAGAITQAQIDSINGQLATVNDAYSKAQALSQQTAQTVETTEQQLQDATGGTAEALRENLADEMAARNEAARNEQKLAKDQAKLNAELAKAEKTQKREQLITNIASTTANVAQAVVQALASLPFPFDLIAAGIVGAAGAVQVGIMTKELTKLEDGGPILGPSHAAGGVNLGSQYNVEGGEFVVNKASYMANGGLIRFINDNPGVTVMGAPQAAAPEVMTGPSGNSNADVIAAIQSIDIKPVVSVTDINKAQGNLTTVQDLAGYNN